MLPIAKLEKSLSPGFGLRVPRARGLSRKRPAPLISGGSNNVRTLRAMAVTACKNDTSAFTLLVEAIGRERDMF